MNKYTLISLIATVSLTCFPSLAGISINKSRSLEEIDPNSAVVDAYIPQSSSSLFVSKHGAVAESLSYSIDWAAQSLTLSGRQKFEGFAPIFLENRDGIAAFKFFARSSEEKASLYLLDPQNQFQPLHIFDREIKNIATSLASNFFVTVDYPPESPLSLARVKLYNTTKNPKNGQGLVELGNIKITNQIQAIKNQQQNPDSLDFDNITGRVSALAMSPLGRVKAEGQPDIPANRIIALAHSLGENHKLHIWYFPDIKKDFIQSKGHIVNSFSDSIETIIFSPNTVGLLLLTNKALGKIWVMKLDLATKSINLITELDVEKPLLERATFIQALFGPNDEILAGINQSLYLFKTNSEGIYTQTDVQPVKGFKPGEAFSRILNRGPAFLAIGVGGQVQFGLIE